jgi:hypothetical protein
MSVDLAALGKALGAFYDYWKQFKGKRIKILVDSHSLAGGHLERQLWTTYVTGIIESIQEYPAGLILAEVEKEDSVTRQKFEPGSGIPGMKGPKYSSISDNYIINKTELERLFLSFNIISEIEWIDE